MHPTGSHIQAAIEDMRQLLNEATFDAKFDDSTLCRMYLAQALQTVMARVNEGSDDRVAVRMPISLTEGQEYFTLPASVQEVIRITRFDENGALLADWRPRGEYHPQGPGWALDGNTLRFHPFVSEDLEVDLWYIPSGRASLHFAVDGATASTSETEEFTLSSAPLIGLVGREENEYLGSMLRILPEDAPHCSRIISGFNATTLVVETRLPFIAQNPNTGISYEVMPAWAASFWPAVASLAALRLGTGRKITQSHAGMIQQQHRVDMKTVRDSLFKMQGRVPRHIDRNTIDNPNLYTSWVGDLVVVG